MTIAACGGDDDSDASVTDDSAPVASMPGPEEFATEGDEATAESEMEAETATDAATGGAASRGLPINDFGRDIITSVGLTMSTSDVGRTVDDIRPIVVNNGGAIFRSDVTIGDERDDGSVPGGGVIVVRIPPQDLDRLVSDLDGVATVSRLSQDSEDVTEQLVDLDIRIRQAETGIERIEALLASATALDDVFTIETELSNRQVALERLRAAQRSTEDLVALATLTIEIEYRTPEQLIVVDDEPNAGIGDALADGWGAFVGAVFAIGYVLAISAPFLVTLLVVLGLAWLIGRRWSAHRAEVRERQRQAADRLGRPERVDQDQVSSAPPSPMPSDRITDQPGATEPEPETVGTDTLIASDSDPSDAAPSPEE